MPATTGTALIVVDVQNDFVSGSLAVPDAEKILPTIHAASQEVEYVVWTGDFHPVDHVSFSDEPQFKDFSWPSHCVDGEWGSSFHHGLASGSHDAVVRKGTNPRREAYSGFDGLIEDNGREINLREWLEERGVNRVYVVGLATDYCVKATAIDAADAGFETTVLADGVRGVDPVSTAMACGEMADESVYITDLDGALSLGL